MSAFLAIVRKELRSVIRERTIIIALVIQLFIASFSSAMLVGLLSLYDPDSIGVYTSVNLSVGLLGVQNDQFAALLRERGIRVIPFDESARAQAAFNRGQVQAILSLPPDQGNPIEMKMFLPTNQATASIIQMILQDALKRYENILRERRDIQVRYTDLKGKPPTTFEFIYSVIIPVLMLFPAFVAGNLVVDSLSEEIENNTFDTLLSAPLTLNTAIGGKIVAAILIATMQCAAWLVLLRLNRIIIQNFVWVLVLAAIVAGIITVSSALVAVWFQDRERSQFVYALFIIVATSLTYWLDTSPIKVMARLAIGDYYTSGIDLIGFAAFLAVLVLVFLRATKRFAH